VPRERVDAGATCCLHSVTGLPRFRGPWLCVPPLRTVCLFRGDTAFLIRIGTMGVNLNSPVTPKRDGLLG